ncbi:MAG: NAD-dependent epimerase/dehydratase family protein [Betaproteobacteria bacterium]|nr:NAD-dependent epimerase/dehydratase family protein [Betaproteobacteria bacterium]
MKILVAGGTGLVGTELLKILAQRSNLHVTALVRRHPSPELCLEHIHYLPFNYENEQDFDKLVSESFDVVFCALGTTRKKAGSAQQFVKVDFEYPRRLIDALVSTLPLLCVVSSVGADRPSGLYLRTKAALEQHIMQSGMRYVILRPSLLLGARREFRLREWLAAKCSRPLQKILRSSLGGKSAIYAPIDAAEVARAMVIAALDHPPHSGGVILQGRDLLKH